MRGNEGNKKGSSGFIPDYARVPLLLLVTIHLLVYFGTKPFVNGLNAYDITISIDHQIPLIPVFIIPYFLAYIQWVIGIVAIARYGREYSYKVLGGEIISKIIVCIIFIVFPTTMVRPEITGSNLFSRIVVFLYSIDTPTNIFPSIHCLESYICMKAAIEMKEYDDRFRYGMVIISILVYLSTVFVKQHVVLDFFGAVIVAEVGRLIAERILEVRR